MPYIPGSTLKGCIRTAVIKKYFSRITDPEIKRTALNRSSDMEKISLDYKGAGDDPFKSVKISDISIDSERTKINSISNVNCTGKKSEKIGILMYFETADINKDFIQSKESLIFNQNFSKGKISLPIIVESCNDFYGGHLEQEIAFFEKEPEIFDIYNSIADEFKKQKDGKTFLLRLGRFSGQLSKIVMRKDKQPGTRNLIEGKIPLGWMLVRFN